MAAPGNPYSKAELAASLRNVNQDVLDFFGNLPGDVFFSRPQGGGWSPAENVKHLTRSAFVLGLGVGTPRFLLRAFFRRASQKPRRFDDVERAYAKRLSSGAGAGLYTPSKESMPGSTRERRQAKLVKALAKAGARLERLLSKWSEADLDLCRLPHPILGLIPVREMFMFTILHDLHHTEIVKSRVPA